MKKTTSRGLVEGLLFIGIVVVFLGIANLVVYNAFLGILAIDSTAGAMWCGSILGLLSLSFIIAMIVGRKFYNSATRVFYYVSSVWLGLLGYLFFSSAAYGLIALIHVDFAHIVGVVLAVVSIVVGFYGIFHAKDIRVTEVSVTLPHIPSAWKGRKAIWVSDVHLGQIYGPSYARTIVRTINSISHDIAFIGGDLFDGAEAHDIKELANIFGGIQGKLGTYYITGNHEEYGDTASFIVAVRDARIRVLLDEKIEIEGMQIIGVDYSTSSDKNAFREILASMSLQSAMPSILLKHEPKDVDVARDAGISFQLSGHTHEGQMWPFGLIANWAYKGFGYGLNKSHDMYVYTSSGAGTWGPPIRVGTVCEIVVITFA